jgi:hypothetical protein
MDDGARLNRARRRLSFSTANMSNLRTAPLVESTRDGGERELDGAGGDVEEPKGDVWKVLDSGVGDAALPSPSTPGLIPSLMVVCLLPPFHVVPSLFV